MKPERKPGSSKCLAKILIKMYFSCILLTHVHLFCEYVNRCKLGVYKTKWMSDMNIK